MSSFNSNKAQEEAINTIYGPVMVVSCPGSGKTTTLIRRIHNLIENGVNPSNILMVTFTKAAADEMREKYTRFFGDNPGVSFLTIHSLCFNLLLREGRCTANDVLQEMEKLDYFASILRMYPQAEGDLWELAKGVATEITSLKNNYGAIQNYEPEHIDPDLFRDIYGRYEEWKAGLHKLDFDDMLILCKEMFDKSPAILKKWGERFQYIQCDEYQDTNMIQRDILYMLAGERRNLCIVGDDDQSIYRFRGARPEIMLHFTDDFPDAKKILMGTNYRSAGEIVSHADRLIQKNKIRYKKSFVSFRGENGAKGYTEYIKLESKKKEIEWLPKIINELHDDGVPYKEIAVLFRTNQQAVLPVSVLSANDIPFYSLDAVRCIYDGWIFRDIKTYIDLSCGNYTSDADRDKMVQSVLNKPNRFLSPDAFEGAEYSISGFRKAIYPLSKDALWKYSQALEEIDTWMRCFGPGKISPSTPPEEVFSHLSGARQVRYDKHMADMAKFRRQEPDFYQDEFDELRSDASNYRTVKEWLAHAEWMSRFIQEESRKKNPDGVVIATMHRAKGLEWQAVIIIDCNDGIIPHKNSSDTDAGMEEERRLFYVAMTRAKDSLYVVNTNSKQSPFIKEAGLLTLQERRMKEEVPKFLPGKKVIHNTFGEGKLVSYGPTTIVVNFPEKGPKTFQFPKAFKDGFLRYGN